MMEMALPFGKGKRKKTVSRVSGQEMLIVIRKEIGNAIKGCEYI